MTIVIEKRGVDFKAFLEGNPKIWATGWTHDSAVGNLIRSHPDTFKIEIKVKSE